MDEIPNESIHLSVTSPPYYNSPYDYPGLFSEYDEFLQMMRHLATQLHRKIAPGRVAAFVADDIIVDHSRFPVTADITTLMREAGFRYRDRIVWLKPKGYTRISHRNGVFLQRLLPMYYYPDNIQESILIFQKGKFDYRPTKSLSGDIIQDSRIDLKEYRDEEWYLNVWKITNVLPRKGRLEEGVAAFPEEIPARLIRLFTYRGEYVLDPFLGSGTTMKVSRELARNSWGYEIDLELKEIILRKVGYSAQSESGSSFNIVERPDAKHLRHLLQKRVKDMRPEAKKS